MNKQIIWDKFESTNINVQNSMILFLFVYKMLEFGQARLLSV